MKYHSTVGKRDRMKMLGLGKETTAEGDPVFNDLDEVIASPMAEWKRPWWVRRVDKPTIEIDWDHMERFRAEDNAIFGFAKYRGADEDRRLRKFKDERVKQWILQNRPGYTLRDQALNQAVRVGAVDNSFIGSWQNPSAANKGFGGKLFSPDELGVPRWEGSPEENSRMVRSAARLFGASQVGFVELDEHTRKLIYAYDEIDGKKLEFEDVEAAYETDKKRVIPYKAKWVIVFTIQMSDEVMKLRKGVASTALSISTTYLSYARSRFIIDDLQTFLHMLGYQALMGASWNGLGIAPAFGVMAGLGEMSRLNGMISPEYGGMQRIFRMITDLPLEPTKPIDAGIMRFCRTCKKCAGACPSGALSMETEPSWEVVGPWSNPGHRAYFQDGLKCKAYWHRITVTCSTCYSVCPFNKRDRSFLHGVVSPTIAATPLLNGFFARMDDVLGYGAAREPESWWDLDLPPYSVDDSRGTLLD